MNNLTPEALQFLLNLGASTKPAITETADGGQAMLVPDGYDLKLLAPLEPKPLETIKQTVVLHERAAFIDYIKRFKTPASQIFAAPGFLAGGQATMVAKLDYHNDPKTPGRKWHTATYSPRYSEEWRKWVAFCSEPRKQDEFAEFIEEDRQDITDPTAARLLDIVQKIKISKKTNYSSVVRQANGDVHLAFDEQSENTGQLWPHA